MPVCSEIVFYALFLSDVCSENDNKVTNDSDENNAWNTFQNVTSLPYLRTPFANLSRPPV